MTIISPQELQQNSDALLDRVAGGECLVIVRGDIPVAELRPVSNTHQTPRPFGLCAGAFIVPDDFNAPLPTELLKDFEGR